jgi:hypothetical protein
MVLSFCWCSLCHRHSVIYMKHLLGQKLAHWVSWWWYFKVQQKGQNLSQIFLRPLTKFGGKVCKIFWTQLFDLGYILCHFVAFMNKIFCSAQIPHLSQCHKTTNFEFLDACGLRCTNSQLVIIPYYYTIYNIKLLTVVIYMCTTNCQLCYGHSICALM